MTEPSELIYKFKGTRNKFILRLLTLLSLLLVGVMVWFYQTIPEENLNRLLGKKTKTSELAYQATPPKLNPGTANTEKTAPPPESMQEYKELVTKLERQIDYEQKQVAKLNKVIEGLNKKVEKQKKIINQLLK